MVGGSMATFPWEWSARIAFCSIACLSAVLSLGAWRQQQSEERKVMEEVASVLEEVQRRELVYYRTNQSYTSDFQSLGMDIPSPHGWNVQVLSVAGPNEPILLVEARGPEHSILLDPAGQLRLGLLQSMPPIPSWVEPEPSHPKVGGAANQRALPEGVSEPGQDTAQPILRPEERLGSTMVVPGVDATPAPRVAQVASLPSQDHSLNADPDMSPHIAPLK